MTTSGYSPRCLNMDAASAASMQKNSALAVSYTHLDVYKRQTNACSLHNISRDYADDIEAQAVKTGLQPFRTDLNVMLASGTNIQGQMEQVDTDLGYTWDSYTDPNSVRIGVNWGYTSSQLESQLDPELMVAIAAFLLLVIFTGYLIIYNIFQISVAGDIRFYGLLKTIGTTPRQLKRIIRQQACLLYTSTNISCLPCRKRI